MRKVALMLMIPAVCTSFVLCSCRTSGQKSAAPLGERLEALKDTSFDQQIIKALAGENEDRRDGHVGCRGARVDDRSESRRRAAHVL